MSLFTESTFSEASATSERALTLTSATSDRTFPLASARAERATRATVAICKTEHSQRFRRKDSSSVDAAALHPFLENSPTYNLKINECQSLPKPPGWGRVRKEWTTSEPDSEIKGGSCLRGEGAPPAHAFLCIKLGLHGLVCELDYGISTFDSECFELELNGRAWVVLEIRFRPMNTMSGLP